MGLLSRVEESELTKWARGWEGLPTNRTWTSGTRR